MLDESNDYKARSSPWETVASSATAPNWTVLIPFFNERTVLDATLASLAAQDVPFELILIDNASTDGSADVAAATCRRLGLAFTLLTDRRPGKVNALQTGAARTRTRFVATCDADTLYPTDYLRQAELLLEANGAVAEGRISSQAALPRTNIKPRQIAWRAQPPCCPRNAIPAVRDRSSVSTRFAAREGSMPRAGATFSRITRSCTAWPSSGRSLAGGKLWCAPSPRERDRDSIRWTLVERVLYHATPGPARDWFFYEFLARRLAGRRLTSDRIRERQFYAQPDFSAGIPRPA